MTDDYKQLLETMPQSASRSGDFAEFMKYISDLRLKAAARRVARAPVSQPVQVMSETELYAWKTRAAQVHLMTDDFKQHLKTMQLSAGEAPSSAPTNDNATPNSVIEFGVSAGHAPPVQLDSAPLAMNRRSGSKYEKFKQELRNRKWQRWQKEEPMEGVFSYTRRRRREEEEKKRQTVMVNDGCREERKVRR